MDEMHMQTIIIRRLTELERAVSAVVVEVQRLQDIATTNTGRLERLSTADSIIRRNRLPMVPRPRQPRDRHGLHAVRCTAIASGLLALARWVWRTRMHRAVTAGAAVALASGAVLTPSIVHAGPPPPAAHHHHSGHHKPPAVIPATAPSAHARHRHRHRHRPHPTRPASSPSPAPTGTYTPPSPSPSPEMTSPAPLPTPTLPIDPTPPPTPSALPSVCVLDWCPPLAVPGPIRTSSSRKPGPRLLAGSTVTLTAAATRARRVDSGWPSHWARVMPAWAASSRAPVSELMRSLSAAMLTSSESSRASSRSSRPRR